MWRGGADLRGSMPKQISAVVARTEPDYRKICLSGWGQTSSLGESVPLVPVGVCVCPPPPRCPCLLVACCGRPLIRYEHAAPYLFAFFDSRPQSLRFLADGVAPRAFLPLPSRGASLSRLWRAMFPLRDRLTWFADPHIAGLISGHKFYYITSVVSTLLVPLCQPFGP